MAELKLQDLSPILRKDWEIDIPNAARFAVKLGYISKELQIPTVRVYENELKLKNGFYLELVNWESAPYDESKRVLYFYKYNPAWQMLYKSTSKNSYLIPISDLTVFKETITTQVELPTQKEIIIEKELEDPPMSTMTLRDYIAIHLQLAVSSKSWINDLIVIKNGNNTSHSGCCSRNN
ncbi:MAG: hypothetical protein EOL97_08575 [Spirochaetia bacterium]|nr:hypothetical protein [Spirochaetia bacterium]